MTKAELEAELAKNERKIARLEKAAEKAKASEPQPPSLADLRPLVQALFDEANANPGDGVLLAHLNEFRSNLDSLERTQRGPVNEGPKEG